MVFRVEKTRDYTVMSNYHLRDKNLSLKAKGMLSLMLSLPEDWDYTLAGLAYICKDGIASIRTTILELEEHGYLSRRRLRNEKGQLGDTEYTIHEKPQKREKPVDNSVDNSPPMFEKPICDNPTLANPTVEKPMYENQTQYNTDKSNKEKENTKGLNNHQSISPGRESSPQAAPKSAIDKIDEIEKFNRYRDLIYKNIEYEILRERNDADKLDEIVETMIDYVCAKRESVKIGKAEYPPEIVKSRLLKLDSEHIQYVLDCMKKNTTKIGNIRAYLLTALYNAPTTKEHHITNLVNHDMANYGNKK